MKTVRLSITLLVAILLTGLIVLVAPQQIPVTIYKLSLITAAAVAGYYIDRELFPYARPDTFLRAKGTTCGGEELAFASAMLRRAIVVAACIIAVALGA